MECLILFLQIILCISLFTGIEFVSTTECGGIPDLNNFIDFSNIISTPESTRVEIQCCQLCVTFQQCQSFFWDNEGSVCQLHSTKYQKLTQTMVPKAGTVYYFKDDLENRCRMEGYRWTKEPRLCFKLYTGHAYSVNYSAAHDICQSIGHRLVRSDSQAKHDILRNAIFEHALTFTGFYLDGSDAQTGNIWLFSDGSPIKETFWSKGEPNGAGNEDCLVMTKGVNFKWNDSSCHYNRKFICEIV